MQRLRFYSIELGLILLLLGAVGFFGYLSYGLLPANNATLTFSGKRAFTYAKRQLDFGARPTGTEANRQTGKWLIDELTRQQWEVLIQPITLTNNIVARNIIAVRSNSAANAPVALLTTHYDTRLFADADASAANQTLATPGANRGASGVAVLLELARTLNVEASQHTVCMVFLDAEENGNINGWEAHWGATYFLRYLEEGVPPSKCSKPRMAVAVDMVGNTPLQVAIERNSHTGLSAAIWQVAAEQKYGDKLINQAKSAVDDVQLLFAKAGIPATLLTDYDYPQRYTMADTLDKLNAESLEAVGRTLELWLEQGAHFQIE